MDRFDTSSESSDSECDSDYDLLNDQLECQQEKDIDLAQLSSNRFELYDDTVIDASDNDSFDESYVDKENCKFSSVSVSTPKNSRLPLTPLAPSNQLNYFKPNSSKLFQSLFTPSQLPDHSQRLPFNLPSTSSFNQRANISLTTPITTPITKLPERELNCTQTTQTLSSIDINNQNSQYDKETLQRLINDNADQPVITYHRNTNPRQTSPGWTTFMLISVNGIAVDFAKCIHCNLVLDSKVTSSMMRHQKNGKCETQKQKLETIAEQARQVVAEQQSNKTKRPDVKLTTEEKEKIKSMSALLCAHGLVPFSLFDNPVFHSYCQMISDIGAKYGAVHYKKYTPSGKTVSRATMHLDQAIKENVKDEIKQVNDVAITADHWTDPIGKQAFFNMNAVYQMNGELVCRQLACRGIDSKECEFTAYKTDEILAEYDIPIEKVSGYVTDLALVSAYDPLEPLPKKAKNVPRKWVHKDARFHGCSRHRLSTIQQDTFKAPNGTRASRINEQFVNCKELVTKFKRTGMQRKLKDQKRVTLKQECSTRFDTKHTMIKSILANEDILPDFDHPEIVTQLSTLDFGLLRELKGFLKVWENAGMLLSNEKKPTLCRVLPTRVALRAASLRYLSSSSLLPLQSLFIRSFDSKYFVTPIVLLAAFLWPTFRNDKRLFSDHQYTIIGKEAQLIYEKKQKQGTNESECLSGPKPPKLPRLLEIEFGSRPWTALTLEQEIKHYRQCFISQNELNLPVLDYWIGVRDKFPILSSVALHVHIIPATQIASERRFNVAKLTLTSKRNALANERFEAQLNINKNVPLCPIIDKQTLAKLMSKKKKNYDSDYDADDEQSAFQDGGQIDLS